MAGTCAQNPEFDPALLAAGRWASPHHPITRIEEKREDPKMMLCVRDYDESMIGTHTPIDDFRMCIR
eukprot:scaffold45716_cov65-Cyclotella_meneghiniana.AAC.6